METTVYLVRHAEAEGNVYRRCHGQYDSLLTPRGLKQLPYLAQRFVEVPLHAIYASDLYRARTTAHAVAQAKGMQVQLCPALREIHMGAWEDCTWAEIPQLYPKAFQKWHESPWDCVLPGGESPSQAGARMFAEVQRLAAAHPGQALAVFTHGTAIRSALAIACGLEPAQCGEIGWGDNTCVAKLLFQEGKTKVVYWNDASHLPEELSTFRAIGWTDNKAVPSSYQIWFRPVRLEDPQDRERLLQFARQKYLSAYGSVDKLDEAQYLEDTKHMLAVCENAVTFGMLEEEPVALVRLNVCDTAQPDVGMVGSFVIEEAYRGKGLSQQLIGQAISVYRALGKAYLCADVAVQNERAKGFYYKFGFEQEREMLNSCGVHYRMRKRIAVEKAE